VTDEQRLERLADRKDYLFTLRVRQVNTAARIQEVEGQIKALEVPTDEGTTAPVPTPTPTPE
jgi:hypothetical protein